MSEKKVLIMRLGAIGDLVHTSVIAQAIKQKHPDWRIDFLTEDHYISLLENHPYIDNILSWQKYHKTTKGFIDIVKKLYSEHYDYFITPTYSMRTILLSFLIFPKKSVFKKSYGGLWVEDYFKMAQKCVKDVEIPQNLILGTDSETNKHIEEEIKQYPKPYFIITPGRTIDNTRQGRLWNIKKWKELSELLIKKYGGTVFTIGSKNEKETHLQLVNNNVVIKTGDYNLNETKSFLSQADLMISGDTGPAHIASALGIKTLALLGSTSPKQIKPYGEKGYYISADYNCLYCWKKRCKNMKKGDIYSPCMEALSPQKVMKKIEEIL